MSITEELKGHRVDVLDDGFVQLVDVMGDDSSIVQAARVSYGAGTKTPSDDRSLIRYLMRHRHCYAPWMQVLTAEGWKRWDECAPRGEKFAVPHPATGEITYEESRLDAFWEDEGLETFENSRMSYSVTSDHRMWFKGKYAKDYEIHLASEMSQWGHFAGCDNLEFGKFSSIDETSDDYLKAKFLGFYLGDGSYASTHRIAFHLKKPRKILFLDDLLSKLHLEFTKSPSSNAGAWRYHVKTPDWLKEELGAYLKAKAKDKGILKSKWRLDKNWLSGVKLGLESSDGSIKSDRPQINFSSCSKLICDLYQFVCTSLGFDCHHSKMMSGKVYRVTSFQKNGKTSLEARKQYFSYEEYDGPVYCTETSSGLLLVRGKETDFCFISGNSTPMEMIELKFLIRVPMDCWRQFIRHRTASVNEYSTRYSEAIDRQQQTAHDEWRTQSSVNNQGSGEYLEEWPEGWDSHETSTAWVINGPKSRRFLFKKNSPEMVERTKPLTPGELLTYLEEKNQTSTKDRYLLRLDLGVAREQARKDLPLSTYTEAYWKIDGHNLMHFLSLRMDSHAQKEIRDYATVIGEQFFAKLFPYTWEAFCDYRLNGMFLTALDIEAIKEWMTDPGSYGGRSTEDWQLEHITNKREKNECISKMRRMGLID